jgi:hypothetical protein
LNVSARQAARKNKTNHDSRIAIHGFYLLTPPFRACYKVSGHLTAALAVYQSLQKFFSSRLPLIAGIDHAGK